jgi:hypothetical protein
VATWGPRATLQGHRDGVLALHFAADGRLYSGSPDTTVLAWDVRPPRAAGSGPLAAAWDNLARAEAGPAFRAAGRLRAVPAAAVELLAARLKPAVPVDPKRLAALTADLDSPHFATRQRATEALKKLGRRAAPALRAVRDNAKSLEARRRAEALLRPLEAPALPPEELRALRAVEVLEWIATPGARRLLAGLAGGDPAEPQTQAAAAALRRLAPSP